MAGCLPIVVRRRETIEPYAAILRPVATAVTCPTSVMVRFDL
jgi:hypothetical protein